MSIKNSVHYGFFSYTPGVTYVAFLGNKAARKRCEISRTKRLEKGAKLADCGLNGVQKFIEQHVGQKLVNYHRHADASEAQSRLWC